MKKKIFDFIKCKEFLTAFFSGIAVLVVWAIIQGVVSMTKGMDLSATINSIFQVANMKVSLIWVILIVFLFSLINSIAIYSNRKKNDEIYVKKEYLTERLKSKLDTSTFEHFEDTYDTRRLESHPWHEQYIGTDVNIRTYCSKIRSGLNKKDYYKVENAIRGLIVEIKKQGFVHKSTKSEIINMLSEYKDTEYNEYKEELLKLLDGMKMI